MGGEGKASYGHCPLGPAQSQEWPSHPRPPLPSGLGSPSWLHLPPFHPVFCGLFTFAPFVHSGESAPGGQGPRSDPAHTRGSSQALWRFSLAGGHWTVVTIPHSLDPHPSPRGAEENRGSRGTAGCQGLPQCFPKNTWVTAWGQRK